MLTPLLKRGDPAGGLLENILIIASFLKNFRDNRFVDSAFYGLRPASTGLIAAQPPPGRKPQG